MIRKILLSAGMLAVLLGFGAPARAQIEIYDLDKPHTQIMFGIEHMGFSTSYGKFLDYKGTVTLDRGTLENSQTEVTIKTASIDLGDQKWNDHMKNADFFDVEKFPQMTFKSTAVKVTGDNTADMTGDLTILGVTKPVTLKVTHTKSGKHAMKDIRAVGFNAEGTLKRSDFGMGYGLPMVGDDVRLIISVEAYEQDPTAAGANNQ